MHHDHHFREDIQNTLYVVVVISNFRQYARRIELYREFAEHMSTFAGIQLVTVELVLRDREFEVTREDPWHVQLVGDSELWSKENMINIGVASLPAGWRYVAWIDSDITFLNRNWVRDTLHQLQHHHIVQLWQTCADQGPDGRTISIDKSFAYKMQTETDWQGAPGQDIYSFAHPGYAWAMRRETWDQLGGLFEYAILGSGDHHMALCWIGKWELSVPVAMGDVYKHFLRCYQDRATGVNVGYVNGTIAHSWHGAKVTRGYNARWSILINARYDPVADVRKTSNGVLHMNPGNARFVSDMAGYFKSRNEDSIDEPCRKQHVETATVNNWHFPPVIARTGTRLFEFVSPIWKR